VVQAVSLFTYFFGELNRLAARSETQERNLLRLMPGASETLRSEALCKETFWREATAAGESRSIPGASKPHLMHAQVYHGDSQFVITLKLSLFVKRRCFEFAG
jgi:hypothetical protein